MATIFFLGGGGGEFFKNYQEYISLIPCESKISTKSLYLTRLRSEKQICVLPFWVKIRKFKMAIIFGEGKIFENCKEYILDTLWDENFDEITISCKVKEIEANLCFAIFGKNSKWPPFLGRRKFFENCQEYTAQLPCG